MQLNNNLSYQKNKNLEIDSRKLDFINFLVEGEELNRFSETEHFYYWFRVEEKVLGTIYNFVGKNPFIYTHDGKDYNLNLFQELSQLVIDVKDVSEVDRIFSGPPVFGKREFFLRYSKQFKRLEYYTCFHSIEKNRTRTKYFIRHKQQKFFSINDKNFVRIYISNAICRYISNKNVSYFRGNDKYFNPSRDFYLRINRRLLNLHLGENLYKSDQDFLSQNKDIQHLSNKFIKGCSSMEQILEKTTKGRPVPKILLSKLSIGEVISLYHLVEFDEVDKIIKFLYEFHDYFTSLNSYSIVETYLSLRLGGVTADRQNKKFIRIHSRNSDANPFDDNNFEIYAINNSQHDVSDYIRMCIMLDKKVNLKLKSIKRLNFEHDELSRKISASQIPKVKTHKSYPKISSVDGFSVELIDDKLRLISESQIQKHCVKTYASKINRGDCCIYSFLEEQSKMRYTLEVQRHKVKNSRKQLFILSQIRGKFNSQPSGEVMDRVSKILKKNNIYLSVEEAASQHVLLEPHLAGFQLNRNQNGLNVLDIDNLPF